MSVETTMWLGVAGLTVITLVFLGPGLWSSATDYPLVKLPLAWLRDRVLRRRGGAPKEK
ncbi:MAG: hypothetical protein IRZ16_01435 [Myxococcaceae bacterium]|nr:hypothetical protein [Myxococcaceae bacterium]